MKNIKLIISFAILIHSTVIAQNWTWQNPLPQGKTINFSQSIDLNTIYACGNEGLVLKSTNGGDSWQVLQRVTYNDLNSLSFKDDLNGFIVGNDGIIIKTNDGGLNFETLEKNINYDLNSIIIKDNTILICGSNGIMLKSIDEGNSWTEVNLENTSSLSEMFFINASKGWMVGEDGLLFSTNDGGSTWQNQNTNITTLLSTVFFIDDNMGFAAGINGSIIKSVDGGSTWQPVNSGTTNWIKSLRFFDNNQGIATGQPGFILLTSDGGENWEKLNNTDSFIFNNISIPDEQTAWLMGQNGVIVKTVNSGIDWEFQSSGDLNKLNDVIFINEDIGWVIGEKGLILYTDNGGETWQNKSYGITKDLKSIYFSDQSNGWISGDSALFINTTDGGDSWTLDSAVNKLTFHSLNDFGFSRKWKFITGNSGILFFNYYNPVTSSWVWDSEFTPTNTNINAIKVFSDRFLLLIGNAGTILYRCNFLCQDLYQNRSISPIYDLLDISVVNNVIVWAVGSYGVVLKATNRNNFQIITHLDVNRLNTVFFLNEMVGYTAGTAGSVFQTTDGGFNWKKLYPGISNEIRKIYFINENTGYLIGNNGLILKLENASGNVTDLIDDKSYLTKDFNLEQNYPNPFNPSTIISWQAPIDGWQTLRVYDILGNEVATIVNGYKPAGVSEIEFNAEGLSSGVYFYQLSATGGAGSYMETKKMLLLK